MDPNQTTPAQPAGPDNEEGQAPVEGAQTPAAPDTEEQDQPTNQDSDGLESLSESWQEQIRSLRAENARRRTEANDLKAQLAAAKSQEDIDNAVADYQGKIASLELEISFQKHTSDLDPDARELVTGETDEQIKASADKVRALLASRGRGQGSGAAPRGGMKPSEDDGDYDPRELARQAREQNRRRR